MPNRYHSMSQKVSIINHLPNRKHKNYMILAMNSQKKFGKKTAYI